MPRNCRESNGSNFMALLNFLIDPAVVVDRKGYFLAVNDAVETLTGLSKKALLGKKYSEMKFLTPEVKALMAENLRKRMQGAPVEPYEISLKDKDGQTRYFELKAKKINYLGREAELVILRDITKRKENLRRLKEYAEKMEELVNEKVKQIRESEEKYRELINQMNDTVWVIDLNGKFIDVNDAAVRVLGYTRNELLKMGPVDIDSSLTKKQILNLIRNMPADHIQVFETTHTTKDGKKIPVEISSSFVTYQGKQAILSIARDITERKKSEAKLLASEKKYRILYEKLKQTQAALAASEDMFRAISTYSTDAIILLDKTDRVVYWNPAAERMFGYSKEEAMGKKLISLIVPPKYRKKHLEWLKKILENDTKYFTSTEIHALKKDNTEIPIELSAAVLSLNGTKYLLETIRDFSERKKMEAALRQERDMLEAVTENVGAGLGIISKDYRIVWVNKYLRQYNPGCEGKICYSTFNNLTSVCPDCGVRKIFDEGVSIDRHEYSFTCIDGKPGWAELIATPIKDEKGNVIAALELSVDITEKKLLQNKLKEYSERLEQLVEERTRQLRRAQAKLVKAERLATIGELAAMVGHDLRNPLTGIVGAAYYLKTKYGAKLGVKGKEMLETIEKAIENSNKIINDLLEYSQDLKLDCTEGSLKSILQDALSRVNIPEQIRVVDATDAGLKFKGDMEKMSNVFVRIIQNAVDAMPLGGTLTIKSRRVKDTLEITFKDTGAGMTQETLKKLKVGVPLFTTKAKGMGFGLPICKRIVGAHGGRIFVKSTIRKGTTVTVKIPVKPKRRKEEKQILDATILSTLIETQKIH
ncbi:MAG: PAS domain S-box protein [Candidatus Bathyarchaeia archaeon]